MLAGGLQKFTWLNAVALSCFLAAELHYKMSGNTQNIFPHLTNYGNNCCCCHKNLKQLQRRRMVPVQMCVGGAAYAIYQTRSGLNNSSVWKAKKEAHLVTSLVSRSLERSKAREGGGGETSREWGGHSQAIKATCCIVKREDLPQIHNRGS